MREEECKFRKCYLEELNQEQIEDYFSCFSFRELHEFCCVFIN